MGADRFRRGDTFHDAGTHDRRPHLWIVCSDCGGAEADVVIVSITTLYDDQRQDTTCVLDVGDHPFIKHPSIAFYGVAEVRKLAALNSAVDRGKLKRAKPVRPDVLARIIAGFAESFESPPECEVILVRQGHLSA